jgi:hypothetical protein
LQPSVSLLHVVVKQIHYPENITTTYKHDRNGNKITNSQNSGRDRSK